MEREPAEIEINNPDLEIQIFYDVEEVTRAFKKKQKRIQDSGGGGGNRFVLEDDFAELSETLCAFINGPDCTYDLSGCYLSEEDYAEGRIVCICNHLSNFGLLFEFSTSGGKLDDFEDCVSFFIGRSLDLYDSILFLGFAP